MASLHHPAALGPMFPAIAMNVSLPPVPKAPPTSYLIARELLSSATRWGGLAVIAMIALGIGIYVALDGREAPKPTGPTERDRAIAIMNGETPPPEANIVHAPQAGDKSTDAQGTTAWRPATEPAVADPATPAAKPASSATAEPITEPAAPSTSTIASSAPTASAVTSAPAAPIAATPTAPASARSGATAEPIATAEPLEPVDDSIAIDDIEIEPMNARQPPRVSRSARARNAKTIAIASKELVEPKTARRASNDPVLAILAEKPVKAAKPIRQLKEDKKPVKQVAVGPAIEIAAPKGAPPAKGTGKVTITSNVAALIFLDGRATGKTAPSALVVPAGDHQITLLEPSTKKAKTASVQVAANKTASVRRDFN